MVHNKLQMLIVHLAFQEANKPGMRETLIEVGFVYYFILARFYDIDPLMQEKEGIHSCRNCFITAERLMLFL